MRVALLLGYALGCVAAGLLACTPAGTPLDLPVPEGDGSDPQVQSQLAEQRQRIQEMAAAGAQDAEIGAAVGELGRLYHAYDYLAAAATCYRKAEALDASEYRWPYCRAFLHQTRGELGLAAAAYAAALERRRDHLPLLVRFADVELGRNRISEAEALLALALELDPRSAAANYGLGRAALARGDADAAVAHLERALEAEPQATKIHHPLGVAYRDLGETDTARFHLERRGTGDVRLVDPPIAELQLLGVGQPSLVRRGLAALERGDAETAVETLRRAVAADGDDLEARRSLALALSRSRDYDAAAAEYRAILRKRPEDAAAHLSLANLLASGGGLENAIEHFRAAARAAPDFKQAHYNLAAALAESGRWQEALAAYDRVLELDRQYGAVHEGRARALAALGRHEEALVGLRTLLASDPGNAAAQATLAHLLLRAGDPSGARAQLESALANAEQPAARARLHLELARLLISSGASAATALEHLDAARRDQPGLLDVAFERGRLLLRLGRPREAAAELEAVTQARPHVADGWLAEAEAWIRAGEDERARRCLETARTQHPDEPRLGEALARLLATSPNARVRDGERAHALAGALLARRQTPSRVETLAMALAELGRFDEAEEIQRQLIDSARQHGAEASWQRRLQQNLQRYERGEGARAPLAGQKR